MALFLSSINNRISIANGTGVSCKVISVSSQLTANISRFHRDFKDASGSEQARD